MMHLLGLIIILETKAAMCSFVSSQLNLDTIIYLLNYLLAYARSTATALKNTIIVINGHPINARITVIPAVRHVVISLDS